MLYISTRGIQPPCKPSEALRQGVPADGGLFVPQTIPQVDQDWIRSLSSRPYYQAVASVLELYLTDFSVQELAEICQTVYSEANFGDRPAFLEQINPYNPYEYLLRLDSGPTASGKDYSMMLVPPLLSLAGQKTGDGMQQLLLTATTGNAGIAALTTMADIENFAVMAFFASSGEPGQAEQEMRAACGRNCFAASSSATFEELSLEIRSCLANRELVEKLRQHRVILSTANSLSWIRIMPAIAYYCWAASWLYAHERLNADEGFVLSVPAGNGSELVAALYARRMGLPIAKILVVTNRNKGLADLILDGSYMRKREVLHTDLPGMDVDLPMNVERLLYETLARDSNLVTFYLNDLINEGIIRLSAGDAARIKADMEAVTVDDRRISGLILSIYDRTDYALDPQTAGALSAYETWRERRKIDLPAVILNLDSPYRFVQTMTEALRGRGYARGRSRKVLITELEQEIGLAIPNIFSLMAEQEAIPLPTVKKGELSKTILEQLGIA